MTLLETYFNTFPKLKPFVNEITTMISNETNESSISRALIFNDYFIQQYGSIYRVLTLISMSKIISSLKYDISKLNMCTTTSSEAKIDEDPLLNFVSGQSLYMREIKRSLHSIELRLQALESDTE